MEDKTFAGFVIVIAIMILSIAIVIAKLDSIIEKVDKLDKISSLESRIARQEKLIQDHIEYPIKKTAFDSTNQVQAFKKIGK